METKEKVEKKEGRAGETGLSTIYTTVTVIERSQDIHNMRRGKIRRELIRLRESPQLVPPVPKRRMLRVY